MIAGIECIEGSAIYLKSTGTSLKKRSKLESVYSSKEPSYLQNKIRDFPIFLKSGPGAC